MMAFLTLLLFLLLGMAFILLRQAGTIRQQTGLPRGRVVYSDTGAWSRVERPLFSHRHLLTGRPDYVVEENGIWIPVEVKPRRTAPQPYPSDILQLAAYCLLIEETYVETPPHGLIKYRDETFAINYTPELRQELLALLEDMRQDLPASDVPRNHESPARCRACGYQSVCDDSL